MLLLTKEPETERAVSLASQNDPALMAPVTTCQDLRELARRLEERPVPVVLADLGPQPMSFLASLEPLVRRYADTRFVVICREFKSELILEAMQIGARNCVVQSSLATELPAVLKRLVPDSSAVRIGTGKVVTVLAASGGCGATTIAINTASELGEREHSPALLADFDTAYGSLATHLGLQGQYGVVDVLSARGVIDSQLVSSTATVYSDHLQVLLSPASVNFSHPQSASYDKLDQMLAACRQGYRYTVFDAPRVSMDVAGALARSSSLTLIVFELAVVDIRCARSIVTALTDRGVPFDSIVAVANRYRKRNPMLGFEDAQKAIGNIEVLRVSNDYESAMRSLNFGKPLSQVAPRSAMRKDIQSLVETIVARSGNENA
jgi:pilus assembly protein CpaE